MSSSASTQPASHQAGRTAAELAVMPLHESSEELASKYKHHIKGKTVLITGATPSSLGAMYATAIAAESPSILILAGRSAAGLARTVADVKAINPNILVPVVEIDLSSQASVRRAASEVNRWINKLDVLVLNAGVMFHPYQKTVDGLEFHFGVNHIGHFLFTNLLMPKVLAAGSGARIVSVSSAAHAFTGVRFDDLGFGDGKAYDRWMAYGQSKTANILFAVELAARLKSRGIGAFAVHPGTVATGDFADGKATSGIARQMSPEDLKVIGIEVGKDGKIKYDRPETYKPLSQGAATHLFASFDPKIADETGSFLADVSVANHQAAPYALDVEMARKLWAVSEDLVDQKFDF